MHCTFAASDLSLDIGVGGEEGSINGSLCPGSLGEKGNSYVG